VPPAERARQIAAGILAAAPEAMAETFALLAEGEDATLAHALALESAAKLRRRTDVAEVAVRFGRAVTTKDGKATNR
jgi:enoyl-CoA hydratase